MRKKEKYLITFKGKNSLIINGPIKYSYLGNKFSTVTTNVKTYYLKDIVGITNV